MPNFPQQFSHLSSVPVPQAQKVENNGPLDSSNGEVIPVTEGLNEVKQPATREKSLKNQTIERKEAIAAKSDICESGDSCRSLTVEILDKLFGKQRSPEVL
ncbi:hypothetical protein K3495_g6199 [Podosphaera aphanis]|nr:hypothetical protein K3495_g6199 [Podosphaera aphanis]